MNSNYLWRSKWENQWRAAVGEGELSRAAGDSPWGNLRDKWLNIHVHLSNLLTGWRFCTTTVWSLVLALFPFLIYLSSLLFYLFGIVIHILWLFASFYVLSIILCLYSTTTLCLYPEAKCPAVFPGWPAPSISSGSVSLCTFSLVMLSDQQISHSIRLKRSRSADKACAEGAPSPRCSICWLRLAPRLSTQDICISPSVSFSLFLYLLAPSFKLVLSLSSSLNY